ncbi:hypothetical protein [Flavobacterium sp. NRK F7]|uniref:hypothetical protein n=1 Tax=Flavobacterium sp. NRK F7 TaxID=2954930 RepID=UPI0020910D3B|nr:hypothetical protein [Flavobacterium sp. NRK F7]MCO6163431.1 hypothetical protein [Flavobacterium sp. NRK F7]
MKRIIVLWLASLFLCANTSIGQLFKFPNLIAHYEEHQNEKEESTITFFDFIKEHYTKNATSDTEEHQDLPFKTFDTTTNILIIFPLVSFQLLLKDVFFKGSKLFFYPSFFKSNLTFSIWLPPKIN